MADALHSLLLRLSRLQLATRAAENPRPQHEALDFLLVVVSSPMTTWTGPKRSA